LCILAETKIIMSKKIYTLKEDLLYGGTLFIASAIGIAFFLFIYELIERI